MFHTLFPGHELQHYADMNMKNFQMQADAPTIKQIRAAKRRKKEEKEELEEEEEKEEEVEKGGEGEYHVHVCEHLVSGTLYVANLFPWLNILFSNNKT